MTCSEVSVSVVIPAHNAQDYLEDAIRSVLDQSVAVAELIVVDDGSTDATAAIAQRFGSVLRYVRQPQSGPGAARNRGVAAASSRYLAFLDADDLWTPDSVSLRVAALSADPSLDAAFGEVEQFVCDRLSQSDRQRLRITQRRLPGLLAGSMLVRRSLFDRVGPFPTEHRAGEFIAWYLQAMRSGVRTAMLGDLVLRRRLHMANLGRIDPESRGDLLAILRADLLARRGAGSADR